MKHEKACGAVITHNNQVLLIYQNNGFWGFPKGHVEPGETEVQTALREVKEETNLDIIINPATRYRFSYYIKDLDIDKEVILFLARLKDPNQANIVKQDSEITQIRWITLNEVESTLTFPEWKTAWRHFYAKLKQNSQV